MPLKEFLRRKIKGKEAGESAKKPGGAGKSTKKTEDENALAPKVDLFKHLPDFVYKPLADPSKEIRLVHIQPSLYDTNPIELTITEAPLSVDGQRPEPRVSLDLWNSLVSPAGWSAHRTMEGRVLFCKEGRKGKHAPRWECPVPGIPPDWNPDEGEKDAFEPRFEALSYMWGADDEDDSVLIRAPDGEFPCITRLRVRPNLHAALRHLRPREGAPRAMWIDALCINQADNDVEKPAQVRRMSAIYRRAHRVVVWLGPDDKWTPGGLDALGRVGRQVEVLESIEMMPSPALTEDCWLDGDAELPFDLRTWKSIYAVIVRPWWSRLWIVQEIRLANSRAIFQCGGSSLEAARVRNGLLCLGLKRAMPHWLRDALSYPLRLLMPSPGLSGSMALGMSYGRKCFDPRDYIYGMLGLFPPGLSKQITPDYTIDKSRVYGEYFKTYASHVNRLELLQWASQAGRKIEAPSWVPDVTADFPIHRHFPVQFGAGASRAHFGFDQTGEVLQAVGIVCANIGSVAKPFDKKGEDAYRALQAWYPHHTPEWPYPTLESFETVFATTLLGNQMMPRLEDDAPTIKEWKDQLVGAGVLKKLSSEPEPPKLGFAATRISTAVNICSGRSFFWTPERYFGLCPPDAKPGDVVVVFLGCDAPILLRPLPDGSYKLVGPCFVHGLNDAISLLGPLPAPWVVQVHEGYSSRKICKFFNPKTKELSADDPRLPPLEDWERIDHTPEADDPDTYDYFRHKTSGEVMNSDPRLLEDALRARGVDLQTFSIA